jgi:hypothetical protein
MEDIMALSETMNPVAAQPAQDGVRTMLRLEGAALLAISVALYARLGGSWQTFAIFILAPDLCMIGYAFGKRAGAFAYNAVHSTLAPLALLAFGLASVQPMVSAAAAIWLAHIGFDRVLGFGLKYASGFRDTHLSANAPGE